MSTIRRASTLRETTLPALHEHNAVFYSNSLARSDDGHAIRLLRVHPGRFEEPLECDLTTVPLNKNADYTALSYSWGEYKKTYSICVNGKADFWVTESAFQAIRRFRSLGSKHAMPNALWIDAICIKQNDTEERNAQVTIMGDIYERAKQVLVWLGPCIGETPGPQIEFCNHEDGHSSGNIVRDLAKHAADPTVPMPSILDPTQDDTSRWWRRCWTFQEAFLARDIGFMIGPHYYSFAEVLCFDRMSGASEPMLPKTLSIVLSALTVRDIHLTNPLYDLLSMNSERHATDPRDKIYSILPLYRDPYDVCKDITVDYARRIEDLVCDVVVELLREGRTLDDLVAIWPSPPAPWPSWLPDLTKQMVVELDGSPDETGSDRQGQFGPLVEHNNEDNPVRSTGPRIIRTEGFALFDEALCIDDIIISISSASISGPLRERDRSRKWQAEADHRLAAALVQLIKEQWEAAGLDRRAQKNRPTPEWQLIRHSLDLDPGLSRKKRPVRSKLGTSSICDWRSLVLQVQGGLELFVTSRGFVGLAASNIKVGDVVAFPTICEQARVLRRQDLLDSESARIVSTCWMPSIQTGVIRDLFNKGKLKQQVFKII